MNTWTSSGKFRAGALLCFVCLFLFTVAQAQKFTCTVDRSKVGTGERFRITYQLQGVSGTEMNLPSLQGFSVAGGPYQKQMVNYVNGRSQQSTEISYDLVSRTAGKYTIQPATMKTPKGVIRSNSVVVEVTNKPTVGQGSKNTPESIYKVNVAKKEVYEGEPLLISYDVYWRNFNLAYRSNEKYPEMEGLWAEEFHETGMDVVRKARLNGVEYSTFTQKKYILIPKAGTTTYGPASISLISQKTQRSDDEWENLFGGNVIEEEITLTSEGFTVRCLPLPDAGKPKSFANAVGRFNMNVSLDKKETESNDVVRLRIRISGNGNLMLLSPPAVKFPETFEVPDPVVSDSIRLSSAGVTGSRTFEYVIIPRSGGEFRIDPVAFSYFDPSSKAYREVRSDTLRLKVSGDVVSATGNNPDVETMGKDIRYINESDKTLFPVQKFFFRTPLYFILAALPFLLTILVVLFRKPLFRRTPDMEQKRIRQADSVALKRLRMAKQMMDENNRDKYYEELNKALMGYLADKYSIAFADMNRAHIREKLLTQGMSEALVHQVLSIVETCEFARFAPGSGEQRADLYQDTLNLITQLEKQKS